MVKTPNIFSFFRTSTVAAKEITKEPMTMMAQGTSGTEIYSGKFDEEYLSKLFDEKGVAVFDEMRRSDGQVKMLLSSVKNPIKSATWDIEPVGEEEIDYQIAEFVKFCLFRDMGNAAGTKRKTFNDFISEALTVVDFGHSVFEIVHKVVKGHKDHGDYIGIADLGFRHQRSIQEWLLETDGAVKAIRQLVNGDLAVDGYIPGQHLLIFSIEKEGDNYQGISMLRPCYGAWFRKNIYRKLQAIGIERCAKSIPIGKIPKDMIGSPDLQTQMDNMQMVMDKYAAHETNAIVLGAGMEVAELKLKHDAEGVQKVIDSENIEMSKAFLANFMELGLQGNSGSFALGSDQSSIFLNGLQYLANQICERINIDLIEPLVKAKYGEQDSYPKIKVTGINDKAGKEYSEILGTLIDRDAVQVSTRLQRHLHKIYKLPDLDEEIAKKDDKYFLEPPQKPEPSLTLNDKKKTCSHCLDASTLKGDITFRLSEADRAEFPVSGKIEDFAADLNDIMQKSLRRRADEMLDEMERLISVGAPRATILELTMPKSKAYTSAITEWAGAVIDKTFGDAAKEVGLSKKDVQFADGLKKAPKKLRDKLITLILLTAGYQDSDLEKAAYFSFNENLDTLDEAALVKEIKTQVDRYFAKSIIQTAALNMAATVVNSTRKETFLSPEVAPEIESFVFMNPDPVSDICRALNGKVFSKEEFESSPLTPPLHHNCKSYIRAQTAGKAGNLPITGLKIDGSKEEVEKIMRSKTL